MRQTDRFGRDIEELGSDDSAPRYGRYLPTLFLIFLALFLLQHRWSIIDESFDTLATPTEALVYCKYKAITVEPSMRVGYIKYSGVDSHNELHMYVTSITRSLVCHHDEDSLAESSSSHPQHLLQFDYRDDYLNISRIDIERVIEGMSRNYPQNHTVTLYHYRHCHEGWTVGLEEPVEIDQHCLSSLPLQQTRFSRVIKFMEVETAYCTIALLAVAVGAFSYQFYRSMRAYATKMSHKKGII